MISINGLCSCPAGTYQLNGICTKQPNCPSGQTWDGVRCTAIQCPPGTFWNGSLCASGGFNCPAGTYYDGNKCATNITICPAGTFWSGTTCQSITCANGFYLSSDGVCLQISQICTNGLIWKNNNCIPPDGTNCPSGTYYNGGQCIPLQPCTNGRIWNSTVSQCVCSINTFWNGNICIQCNGGQIYITNIGCSCATGTFFNGSNCNSVPVNQCASIPSSIWDGNKCICNFGYTMFNMQCTCQGLAVNSTYCDRCYNKPNSSWLNGICQCNTGYSDSNGQCVLPKPPNNNTNPNPSCNVATYFDSQQLRCLPCTSGCLTCTSCYSCTSCQPGFYLDFTSSLCIEICGDGKRFILGCDDGNNINGDGCSNDCKIELGYICTGGSPNSKDNCTKTLPKILTFSSTGQSHLFGKIIINIVANYIPLNLIQSSTDCANSCRDILSVQIISGDKSATSIIATYIPTTSFGFSV